MQSNGVLSRFQDPIRRFRAPDLVGEPQDVPAGTGPIDPRFRIQLERPDREAQVGHLLHKLLEVARRRVPHPVAETRDLLGQEGLGFSGAYQVDELTDDEGIPWVIFGISSRGALPFSIPQGREGVATESCDNTVAS